MASSASCGGRCCSQFCQRCRRLASAAHGRSESGSRSVLSGSVSGSVLCSALGWGLGAWLSSHASQLGGVAVLVLAFCAACSWVCASVCFWSCSASCCAACCTPSAMSMSCASLKPNRGLRRACASERLWRGEMRASTRAMMSCISGASASRFFSASWAGMAHAASACFITAKCSFFRAMTMISPAGKPACIRLPSQRAACWHSRVMRRSSASSLGVERLSRHAGVSVCVSSALASPSALALAAALVFLSGRGIWGSAST